jgi:predicted metalloprotease
LPFVLVSADWARLKQQCRKVFFFKENEFMKWLPGGESQDIEDRRDESGGGGFQFGGIHIGIGGAIVLLILSFIFRTNLFTLLGGGTGDSGTAVSQPDPSRDAAEKPLVQFVSFVLDDTQNTWTQLLPQQTGTPYRHAKLVLFRDYTQSGCGGAGSATGPFYCPEDEKVYIDLGFFDELNRRFGAPGQFAQAYVIAHELGHHVQKLTGIEGKVHQLQESNSREANPLSVKLELQADCFAGVWAHSTQQRGLLEKGDVESALGAASAVGDDRLQKMPTGHVSPESFTHGSSQQRMRWFNTGLNNGTIAACNTFGQPE